MTVSREIRLARRPEGRPTADIFEVAEVEVKPPEAGDVEVQNLWMSVDPYMANRLYEGESYVPAYRLGKPLDGAAIGVVTRSCDVDWREGELVSSHYGWRERFVAPARRLTKLDPGGLPPQAFLGIAGVTGATAHVGLFEIGRLQPGETVYVSAAAGAVGLAACQMAKLHGATVIGSAGGAEKCAVLRELGVDHAIDYRAEELAPALKRAAPDGIQLFFDNVGGPQLQAAMGAMANFGRIAVCGMISQYAGAGAPPPDNMFEIVSRRLNLTGFLLNDHPQAIARFDRQVREWLASGKLVGRETVLHGIENAPAAFLQLLTGGNVGKMLVRLG